MLPKGYKVPRIRITKLFKTTKIHEDTKVKCPRCKKTHILEEGEFINNPVKWKYVTCKDRRTYLIV